MVALVDHLFGQNQLKTEKLMIIYLSAFVCLYYVLKFMSLFPVLTFVYEISPQILCDTSSHALRSNRYSSVIVCPQDSLPDSFSDVSSNISPSTLWTIFQLTVIGEYTEC